MALRKTATAEIWVSFGYVGEISSLTDLVCEKAVYSETESFVDEEREGRDGDHGAVLVALLHLGHHRLVSA